MKHKLIIWNKFTCLLIAITLMLNIIPNTINAQEIEQFNINTTIISSDNGFQNIFINDSLQKRPNIWSLEAQVSGQDDKITISAHNIGIDTIDKISCKVKVTDKSGIVQYNKTISFTDIKPLIHQTYKMIIKNWKKIEITNVQAWDGSDYDTHSDHTILRED